MSTNQAIFFLLFMLVAMQAISSIILWSVLSNVG